MNKPFMAGYQSKLLIYINGTKMPFDVTSWSIKQNSTNGVDHINGEDRATPWRIIDSYEFTIKCKHNDGIIIRDLLEETYNDLVENAVAVTSRLVLVLKPKGDTNTSITTKGITRLMEWDWSAVSRTDRLELNLKFIAQDLALV